MRSRSHLPRPAAPHRRGARAVALCCGVLAAVVATAPGGAAGAAAPQRVKIEVRGPLALVELERPLRTARVAGQRSADEVVLDLALPPGARVAAAEVRADDARVRPRALPAAAARAAYGAAVIARAWRPAKVGGQIDEGADLRIAVAGAALGDGDRADRHRVRVRFVAPLACRGGDLVLAFPAALDATPTAADVTVDVELGEAAELARIELGARRHTAARGRRTGVLHASVETGSPWQVVVSPRRPPLPGPGAALVLAAAAPRGGRATVAAGLCRGPVASEGRRAPPPGRVLFVIDRSRSMGPTGAASAGALARALALALPPGARFAAVLYDRAPESLAPTFRAPTLEALASLEAALAAGSLRNGSQLLPALAAGQRLLTADAAAPSGTLVVVVTDGALPEDHTRARLEPAALRLGGPGTRAAVLVLRGAEEEPLAPFAAAALGALPARLGGVYRQIDPVGAAAGASDLVAALAAGGDLVDLRAGALRRVGEGVAAVAPGAGVLFVGAADPHAPIVIRGAVAGRARVHAGAPIGVEPHWAGAIVALASAPEAGPAWASTEGDALVLATAASTAGAPADLAARRGQLDRDVVHKSLAYAYLPRARACYLTRAVKTAADFRLRGRLRLELHLERGEMMDAVIARSSLGRADIERCLREAAFLIDVPRPVLADAPAIAALNLVFRPRSDGAARDGGPPGPLDRDIERILGPRGPPVDPLELLIEDDRPAPAGVGPVLEADP